MVDAFCKQVDCYRDTGCIFGNSDPSTCPHRIEPANGESVSPVPAADATGAIPWHGGSLGETDLQFVAARRRPFVVGVVGPHSSGKTTFLTALYLTLSRGVQVNGYRFAGSYTLRGWEQLANHLRYPTGVQPKFPRHTPVTTERVSGLLHLAFRKPGGELHDILLTDAPGEWFANWAIDKHADSSAGARWIARHADLFLLFLDCDQLGGANRGEARHSLFSIAHRLSEAAEQRRVLLIWSKVDVALQADAGELVRSRLQRLFPKSTEHRLSIKEDAEAHMEEIARSTLVEAGPSPPLAIAPVPFGTDPFFMYGTKRPTHAS